MSEVTHIEEWRIIPEFGGRYRVSNLGNVQSCAGFSRSSRPRPWANLSLRKKKDGHVDIKLSSPTGKKTKRYSVHRLVLVSFTGIPYSSALICRHLNDIPWDNRLENLAWGTRKDNIADRDRNGYIYPTGKDNPNYRHGLCCGDWRKWDKNYRSLKKSGGIQNV